LLPLARRGVRVTLKLMPGSSDVLRPAVTPLSWCDRVEKSTSAQEHRKILQLGAASSAAPEAWCASCSQSNSLPGERQIHEAHMGRAWITDRRPAQRPKRHPLPAPRLELPLELPTEREALPPEKSDDAGARGIAIVDFYI
jgi:hypothetical protein